MAIALVVSATSSVVQADETMEAAMASYEAGDYQQALEIWLLKAYEGNDEAQYQLGRMFADGTGTVVDLSEAVYWYTRAAEQGHAAAQYELGSAFFHGAGASPDKARAIEWWQLSAENGNPDAQYHLGRAYFYGIDLKQDSRLAVEWFSRAAGNGSQLARDFLDRVGVDTTPGGAPTGNWTGYGRVGERPIWVYSSFNRLSPILDKLEAGSLVRVVEQRAGWFRVQVPGGIPVWVRSDRVEEVEDGHRIAGVGVPARPDPANDPSVKPVGMFLDGDRVTPIEERGEWTQVQAPESISAWVEAIDVDELAEDAAVAEEWRLARGESAAGGGSQEPRKSVVLSANVPQASATVDSGQASSTTSEAAPAGTFTPEADGAEGVAREVAPGNDVSADSSTSTAGPVDPGAVEAADGPSSADVVSTAEESETDDGAITPPAERGEPAQGADFGAGDYLRVGPQAQSIYARNRLSSARIDLLPANLLVRVVERQEGWVKVQVPGGLPLWIYSRFIDRDGDAGRITGEGVRARPLPSTSSSSQPVGVYPEGAEVRVISESEQWVRIHAPEDLSAWMQLEGLFTVAEPGEEIAAQWRTQGRQGIVAIKERVAGADSASEQASPDGADVVEAEPETPAADARTGGAVRESMATDVEFGRVPDGDVAASQSTAVETAEAVEITRSGQDPAELGPSPETPPDDTATTGSPNAEIATESAGTSSDTVSTTDSIETGAASEEAVTAAAPDPEPQPRGDDIQGSAVEEVVAEEASDAPRKELSVERRPEGGDTREADASIEGETGKVDEAADAESPEDSAGERSPVDYPGVAQAPADPAATPTESAVDGEPAPSLAAADEGVSESRPDTGARSEAQETPAELQPGESETGPDVEKDSSEPGVNAMVDDGQTEEAASAGQVGEAGVEATDASGATVAGEPRPSTPGTAVNVTSGSDEDSVQIAAEAESENALAETLNESTDDAPGEPKEETVDARVDSAAGGAEADAAPAETGTQDADDPADAFARVRFDDLVWLYSQSGEAFSIEVLRDAERDAVSRAAEAIGAGRELVSFSTRDGDGVIYNLMVGVFPDLLEVKQALSRLQSLFESIRIRRLGAVQQEWCGQIDNLTPEQLLLVLEKCGG